MYRFTVLLGLLITFSCALSDRKPDRNLVIITLDTVRKDAIGCYGSTDARTPCLDRFARRAILFADAQVPVPITLPSHASLFTGHYPALHGSRHNGAALIGGARTLAEMLSEKGYVTAGFPAATVLNRSFGLHQGFDVYDDNWKKEEYLEGQFGILERRADAVVSNFLRWLDDERGGGHPPFFAWVHFFDAHTPYAPPEPFTAALAGDPYAGEIAFVDRQVGIVIDALETRGILDETIVVILADHGEALGERGESEHGLLLYENTIAIPWLLRLPGLPGGIVISEPVESTDLLPTLAELLPLDPDPSWPGKDIAPLVGIHGEDSRRLRYFESFYGNVGFNWAPLQGVRMNGWKLVRGNRDELFHLPEDPFETKDLSETERGMARRMGRVLDQIIDEQPEEEPERESALTEEQKATLRGLGYVTPSRSPGRQDGKMLDPRDCFRAHELFNHGRMLALGGDPLAAEPLYREGLSIDPLNVYGMTLLDETYSLLGRDKERESLLLEILSIDPYHTSSWIALGTLAEGSGREERAAECYTSAIESDSASGLAWAKRGNLLFSHGREDEAFADFCRAIEAGGQTAAAHYGKALVYYRRGGLEKVVEELKLALRVNPEYEQARSWLLRLEQQYRASGR